MAKLLGIDVGTTGCRVILIDDQGKVLKSATSAHSPAMPRPNWSEQDPQDWWLGVQSCLREIDEPNPDAIGLTGQMHGAVFLDSKDEVIRPAILWNDQRTVAECALIDRLVGPERVRQITANPPLTGFQLPKILWLKNNEAASFARVRSVLLPKDYIRFKLTGAKSTEVSDASGTGIFDVPLRRWSRDMIDVLELDPSIFPEVFESHVPSSKTSQGVPVVGGGGDQAAGAVGTGAVESGIVSVSLGTSGVVFASVDEPKGDSTGAIHCFCHANEGWHSMGVMLSCGGALKWLRSELSNGSSYEELATLAASASIGSEGLTFLPYLTGERSPHNDPSAKGSWSGLTQRHTFSHLARSVFEGATFGLLDCYNALKELGPTGKELRLTGGGSRNPFWVQMIADVFEMPGVLLDVDEGPAFGAAILAGVGIGVWPNVPVACRTVVKEKTQILSERADYSDSFKKYRELYSCLKEWNLS